MAVKRKRRQAPSATNNANIISYQFRVNEISRNLINLPRKYTNAWELWVMDGRREIGLMEMLIEICICVRDISFAGEKFTNTLYRAM